MTVTVCVCACVCVCDSHTKLILSQTKDIKRLQAAYTEARESSVTLRAALQAEKSAHEKTAAQVGGNSFSTSRERIFVCVYVSVDVCGCMLFIVFACDPQTGGRTQGPISTHTPHCSFKCSSRSLGASDSPGCHHSLLSES